MVIPGSARRPERLAARVARLRRLALAAAVVLVAGCATYSGARHYVAGTEALERGQLGRAVTELEAAARLVPGRSDVHNHLGLAYLASGRRAQAGRAFERALALDCSNAAARDNLAALEAVAPGALAHTPLR